MSTHLLAIDTASGIGRVALTAEGKLLDQRAFSNPRAQAEEIYPMLASLLEGRGLRLEELAAIAVATGPGAFTSLRVGLTVAKSLAEVSGLALLGISNMEAMARLVPGFPAAIVLPASRGEVFWCCASASSEPDAGGALAKESTLTPVGVAAPASWLANLTMALRYVVSPSAEFLDLVAGELPPETRCVLVPGNGLEPLAAIAWERHCRGAYDNPLSLDACYARKDDADGSWVDVRIPASPL